MLRRKWEREREMLLQRSAFERVVYSVLNETMMAICDDDGWLGSGKEPAVGVLS